MRSAGVGSSRPYNESSDVAVDLCGRCDEAARVGQVPGPALVHVHRRLGKGPGHVSHTPGMVEVDVGDHHPRQLPGRDAERFELGEQHGHARLAAGLDQHRGVAGDEVAGGDVLPPSEQCVDLDDPRGDRLGHGPTVPRPSRPRTSLRAARGRVEG